MLVKSLWVSLIDVVIFHPVFLLVYDYASSRR